MDIRLLTAADADVLTRVAEGVFDNDVDPTQTALFLADPRHHLCVAIDDGVVVAFASAVHYEHPDKPTELWINEVATAPSHQRRGLSRAILQRLLAHARDIGCAEAWVLTDHDNAPARALYSAVGGEETTDVVMVSFKLGGD